jgi:hypothetical protein
MLPDVIHHEMSTILLNGYDIYDEPTYNSIYSKFMKWNGESVHYTREVTSGEIDASSDIANYFYKQNYARTNFENDFNTIAQYLFTNGKEVVAYINARPNTAIEKKVKEVISFYQKLDNKFTVGFFSRIAPH